MDLTRPVTYRGLALNDGTPEAGTGKVSGITLDDVVLGLVPGVGYTEKRAQGDGRDASDVYLDGRRFAATGTVYGRTRGEAHDKFQELKAALTPTSAFNAEPGNYGYLPLSWQEPTEDTRYTPDVVNGIRYRSMYANVRSMATPEQRVTRDRSGGRDSFGMGFQFSAQFEAKDPRLYVVDPFVADFTDDSNAGTGTFLNRGNYPAPLNILLVVKPHTGTGQFRLDTGGSKLRIELPPFSAPLVQQVYRYDGQLKVLTVEENAIESLRFDLLSFENETTHPLVKPVAAGQTWSWSSAAVTGPPAFVSVPMAAMSRMWFNEAYA